DCDTDTRAAVTQARGRRRDRHAGGRNRLETARIAGLTGARAPAVPAGHRRPPRLQPLTAQSLRPRASPLPPASRPFSPLPRRRPARPNASPPLSAKPHRRSRASPRRGGRGPPRSRHPRATRPPTVAPTLAPPSGNPRATLPPTLPSTVAATVASTLTQDAHANAVAHGHARTHSPRGQGVPRARPRA